MGDYTYIELKMEETERLLAEKLFTTFNSKKYVDWAIALMEKGYESESLYILAGLDNDETEVREKYFSKAIEELNININVDNFRLLHTFAIYIAQKVVNKEIDSLDGLKIFQRIIRESDYDKKYMKFFELDEDLDYLNYDNSTIFNVGMTKENKEQFIFEEFKNFLKEDINHP